MELWKASMRLTTEDSSEHNGFGAIVISDPNLDTLNSSTTGIIATVASEGKPLCRLFTKRAMCQSYRLQSLNCRKSTTSQTEPSPSSGLSEVIGGSISLENISNFLKPLSILMSELKSLRVYIKFKSILGMSWLPPFRTIYLHGLLRISTLGDLCIDAY